MSQEPAKDLQQDERRALTRRLIGVMLRRRGLCAAAFVAMLFAGLTDSAPVFFSRVFVDDVLLAGSRAKVEVGDDGSTTSVWRGRDGIPAGVRIESSGASHKLTEAEALAAGAEGPSAFARAALSAGKFVAGDDVDPYVAVLGMVVFAILLTALTAAGSTYAASYTARALATHIVTDVRSAMMDRLLRAPLGYFARRKIGDLHSRFTHDAALTQHTVDVFISEALLQPFIVVCGVGIAAWINWRLALVGFIVLPLVIIPVLRLGKKVQKQAKRAMEAMGETTEAAAQTLSGMRIVKTFAAEAREAARFREINEDWRLRSLKAVRARALGRGVMDVAYGVILAIVLSFGGILVTSDAWDVRPGDFVAFLVALAVVLQPLKRIVHAFHTWQEALAAAQRLFEIVDLPPDVLDASNAPSLGPVRRSVRFEHVSFRYPDAPDLPVLNDVDFEIPAGKTTALVGASGAGKSTVADLLLRFYEPTDGKVYVDDVAINEATRSSLLAQIAVVSQQPFLFNVSVAENIRYGRPDATPEEVRAAADAALVTEFLPKLPNGLDTIVGDRGASLSGGQLQRITIARALLKNASILILDEATSNLDPRSESLVQKALFNLVEGRTALVIAHRFSTVERADEILVLERGRIVERGRHEELLARRGAYFRLREAHAAA